jgi:hypothetical protein
MQATLEMDHEAAVDHVREVFEDTGELVEEAFGNL